MTPDYTRAATKAVEMLIKYNISFAPVDPIPVLKKTPGVLVISYEDMSNVVGMERNCVMPIFGEKNQDAFTSVSIEDGVIHYLVTYNQRLPFYIVQRALARELGHIVLGHDGSRPEKVRNEEAKCFAHHFLCPRAMIHSIQALNIRLTTEVLGNLTGCNDYCLCCMREMPEVRVPAELNRIVRDQFKPYIYNYFEFQRVATHKDNSAVAYLGTFMNGYEE